MNQPATFIFVSTLEHIPWGGCEDLWYKTALHALAEKQKVLVVVFRHDEMPPHLQKLSDKGATFFFLERNAGKLSIAGRIKNKVAPGKQNRQVFQKIDDILSNDQAVHVLVSQAGGFDFAYTYLDIVREWLLRIGNFHVVVQNVPDLGFTISLEKASCQQEIFDGAQAVGFVSKRNQLSAERILAADIRNSFEINNPLNFDIIPEKLPWPSTEPVIKFGVAAALRCFHKGQDILLQVLSQDIWRGRNWVLNLYGRGPDEKYLHRLTEYYSIEERVFFHGHVDDINEVWQENHMHVLPSLGEGTPLALIESMACGRPAVTTNVGGNAEYITHMQNGFIADYPTFPALQKVMELAWENQHQWEVMGEKARAKILESYDLKAPQALYELLANA